MMTDEERADINHIRKRWACHWSEEPSPQRLIYAYGDAMWLLNQIDDLDRPSVGQALRALRDATFGRLSRWLRQEALW